MKLLAKYMPFLLLIMSVFGSLVPSFGELLFPFLSYGLWAVMTITLLGIDQRGLLVRLSKAKPWYYALVHTFGILSIAFVICLFLPISHDLRLAILVMTASGTLFSTPAIARIVGLNVVEAVVLTIATTILSPIALVLAMLISQNESVQLDLYNYSMKLLIFIIGPMLVSFLSFKLFGMRRVCRLQQKITPYVGILVLMFPAGLSAQFGRILYKDPREAFEYMFTALVICIGCFFVTYFIYRKSELCDVLLRSIASGNRNALLTYTIAAPMLGSAFLPLMGAMQIPLNILPILIIIIFYYSNKKQNKEVA